MLKLLYKVYQIAIKLAVFYYVFKFEPFNISLKQFFVGFLKFIILLQFLCGQSCDRYLIKYLRMTFNFGANCTFSKSAVKFQFVYSILKNH